VRLVLASGNPGKLAELQALFAPLGIELVAQGELGIAEAEEPHPTFIENALAKARHAAAASRGAAIADDSGLVVDALDGAPGVRSARFSGRGATDEKNIRKLLRMMEDVPPMARKGRFVCRMVLSRRGRVLAAVGGEVRGTITGAQRGKLGFGYDPVFYYRPWRKTFGEIPPGAKNAVSHRGRALAKIKDFLKREGPPPWGRGRASGGGAPLGGNQASRPRP
jgi:XTP/dITP diphosphohydrolase